jgi:hypothetical protein
MGGREGGEGEEGRRVNQVRVKIMNLFQRNRTVGKANCHWHSDDIARGIFSWKELLLRR